MQEHHHAYANVPPFLEKFTASSWAKFLSDYEGYKGRGGTRPVKFLISTVVLRLISIRFPDVTEAEDDDFIEKVSGFFAPKSAIESFDRFKKLSMSAKQVSIDAVLNFILCFEKEESLCEVSLPTDKILKKAFIDSLRPIRLGARVAFREPKSLQEAKLYAIEEAEMLSRWSAEMAATSGADEERESSRKTVALKTEPLRHAVKKENEQNSVETLRWQPTCHECGEVGHIRPDCPKRKVNDQKFVPKPLVGSQPPRNVGSAKSVKPANVSSEASVPRIAVKLSGLFGDLNVSALFDTGASGCFIAKSLFGKVQEIGVAVRSCNKEVIVANKGKAVLSHEVECFLTFDPRPELPTGLKAKFVCHVLDTDEEVILGFGFLQNTGLLSLLAAPLTVPNEGTQMGEHPESTEADAMAVSKDQMPESTASDLVLKQGIKSLMKEFVDIFSDEPLSIPALVPPMPIVLRENAAPKSVPPRRMSPAMRQVVDNTVDSLLAQGIIRPSMAPISSPVVVVRREQKDPRLCVDYRELNANTVDMQFPMQNTHAILERLAGMRLFATMDLKSGFHQMPLEESAMPLTAFSTPSGLYEYTRIPFGLKNAPRYFQKVMTEVLSGLVGRGCEVFVDDICVCAASTEEFLSRLRPVFERLRTHGLRLKSEKCCFGVPEVAYLGHVANGDGVRILPSKQQAITGMVAPSSRAQLRSFLGFANYMRNFVPNFATLAAPLSALCSEKLAYEWTDECQNAFDRLKYAIVDASSLHHLDYAKEIILRTDASINGIGGVLLQRSEGKEQPVWYLSRKFTAAESKWSTIEQEAFAIFYCITELSHFLLGHRFVVETDHRNLVYLHQATAPKLVRWRLRLQESH
eukprot:ANDGO_00514.mRNA.1 Retrovirus-related Pol polyprotein from transposon 412